MPFTVLSLIYWIPILRSWKVFEAKSFAVFLTTQYEIFMFVTNFPFKCSWWAALLSATEGLKEGWKEMFLTAWKGLHNFFHSYWLAPPPPPHHFSDNASLTRSFLVCCNRFRHYLLSMLIARVLASHMRLSLLLVLSFAPRGFPILIPV